MLVYIIVVKLDEYCHAVRCVPPPSNSPSLGGGGGGEAFPLFRGDAFPLFRGAGRAAGGGLSLQHFLSVDDHDALVGLVHLLALEVVGVGGCVDDGGVDVRSIIEHEA